MAAFTEETLAPLSTFRAEDLSADELRRWTGSVADEEPILRRLTGSGPKLLKGPRGSGKSSYLKRAYFRLQERGGVMVAYVNYSQHLALEPLMLRSDRALEYFRQWLLYKIVIAVDDSLTSRNASPQDLHELAEVGKVFVHDLETNAGQQPASMPPLLSPSQLLDQLETWCDLLGLTRAVLLMDDAAHAFMQQQQREFFEVFRALRSRRVACKAAIYPGVTSYSPFFNVGHEAEEIEVWIRPDSSDYLQSMRSIFSARFPQELQDKVRPELVDVAAHASFGLPRNFLNILSDSVGFSESDDDPLGSLSAPTFARLRTAIQSNSDRVRALFTDISAKLPRYENFVAAGAEIQHDLIRQIRDNNRQRSRAEPRYIGVAIASPWDGDLKQTLALLEYSGVVRRIGPVSRGKDQYEKVQVHSSLLIADNALALGRNVSAELINVALRRQNADDFVRRQPESIFPPERAELCKLNLTPCPKCNTPRISDDAVFCFRCGHPLTEQSVYIDLLSAPIDRLALTPVKLQRIQELTSIRTVQDVILDDGGLQLRTVPSIGKVWSARIKARADEFVTL